MKFILLECKKCGAKFKVDGDLDKVVCDYCGAEMLLVDENQTDMERLIKALGKNFQSRKIKLFPLKIKNRKNLNSILL